MISYRGDEAIDWFGFSRLWSQTVGYAVTTSRIDSLNRRKTLSESLASARLLFCGKGSQYEESVKLRLEALIRLKETLEQDFQLHSYMPRFYSFTTQIKADYLIFSMTVPVDFIFIIKSSSSGEISICDFVCCSAFTQTKRDYRENQRPRSILKKERIHIATNTTKVLFDRLNRQQ